MTFAHRLFLFLLLLCIWSTSDDAGSSTALACIAIIAGRKTTADGSVLVGHNEQDQGQCLISFDRVPRQPMAQAVPERLRYRARPVPAGQTASFLWSECIPKNAAGSYLNEYGVSIVSNKCRTRQHAVEVLAERGEIRQGGIGYRLRRLVAQQATTAREGVMIAGDLVERFGYALDGRTYTIADPKEAWLLAMVRGRHWVARRVPDNAVVVLPNVHVIRRVNLADTANFLGSPDLVDYAVRRGWYDPTTDGPFDFRKVYREVKPPEDSAPNQAQNTKSTEPNRQKPSANGKGRADQPDPRRWWAHQLITGREIRWPPDGPLPFRIRPKRPMTVASVAEVLRSRDGQKPLSADHTREAAVFQLRADLPRPIGCVYWRVTCEPSTGVLTPWYSGITKVPDNYHEPASLARRLTLDYHFNPPPQTFRPNLDLAWWKFKAIQDLVHKDYENRIGKVRPVWAELERRLMAQQQRVEQEALRLWREDQDAARDYLTRYCAKAAAEACRGADRLRVMLERTDAGADVRPRSTRRRQQAYG